MYLTKNLFTDQFNNKYLKLKKIKYITVADYFKPYNAF